MPEPYILTSIPKIERSYLAQFRFGILPLHIETGRYIGRPIHERICIVCGPDANEVEDEIHFLLKCSKYNDLRQCLFIKAYNKNNDFNTFTDDEKLIFLLNNAYIYTARYIYNAFQRRKSIIYN